MNELTISTVYFSGSGTTARLAAEIDSAIADEHNVKTHLLTIMPGDIREGRWENGEITQLLDSSHAILFGSPTYMGGIASQMKSFMDAMAPRWYTQRWQDKLAAGFTVSSLHSGDKLNCLTDMTTFAMQMGMIWCGCTAELTEKLNPHGYYLGVGAVASSPEQLTQTDLAAGRSLGQRVVRMSRRFSETQGQEGS